MLSSKTRYTIRYGDSMISRSCGSASSGTTRPDRGKSWGRSTASSSRATPQQQAASVEREQKDDDHLAKTTQPPRTLNLTGDAASQKST